MSNLHYCLRTGTMPDYTGSPELCKNFLQEPDTPALRIAFKAKYNIA